MSDVKFLEIIKRAIECAQKKGCVYYPCSDDELLNEWSYLKGKTEEEIFESVEINAINSTDLFC